MLGWCFGVSICELCRLCAKCYVHVCGCWFVVLTNWRQVCVSVLMFMRVPGRGLCFYGGRWVVCVRVSVNAYR